MKFSKTILLILILSIVVNAYSQNKTHKAVPSISEIILPSSAQTKDNFNLMYEVHLSRNNIPTPSFWYKIIFNTDCDFEFTLFPLVEEDGYEFFMYKIEANKLFCKAMSEKKVTTLNHYKYTKKYTDTDQSKQFRSTMIHVKPIPIKAGDAIYLSVIAVKGKDCGHILDCRTSVSSMVIKVINDNCSKINPIDTLKENVNKEELALNYLSDELCNKKQAIKISAIDLKGKKMKVNNKLNFHSYAKKEKFKYKKYEVNTDTILEVDSTSIETTRKDIDNINPINKIKTTSDLNLETTVNENQTFYQTHNHKSNLTRFKVDRVMFNLLLKGLTENKLILKEDIKNKYSELKKTNKKHKKKEKFIEIKQLKKKRKTVEKEIASVKIKLKKINKLISKDNLKNNEDFVFDGSINNVKTSLISSEGLIYKVQIGAYKNKISKDIFKGLSPVYEDPYADGVKYSVGAFKKLLYAKQAKKYVVDLGVKDAFIVAYFDGKRIPVNKAIKLE
ncbi:MAG: hypothetical protein COB15_13935 [Flavobacteriales bacterium]|nr:MAG: hypothetical protein COB15_13935 [Flavobacteriales bacterium]